MHPHVCRHKGLKMCRPALILIVALISCLSPDGLQSEERSLKVTATNGLDLVRLSETIVLSARDLSHALQEADLRDIHVKDISSGRELLAQAVDLDGDSVMDQLLFQADFRPRETRTFSLTAGARRIPRREEFKVYGRFVRERYDDFAWENDRIAHRMYGTALETWQKEPLTSSAVDVWCKRVRRLVINDWYMVDNYHQDTGEGADFYSAGKSRGCGGSGIWQGGKLYVSRNFVDSRVIANGPIRVMFELKYAPWPADGRTVSEVKRITLDAGWNLDRFESRYTGSSPGDLLFAAGIKKGGRSTSAVDRSSGWLRSWEPMRSGEAGNLGCAIIVDPALLVDTADAEGNYLVVARPRPDGTAVYYAGFGWDRSGDFADEKAWAEYVSQSALRLRSPLKLKYE